MIATKPKYDYTFIAEVIQRGRVRPAKFIHNLEIPFWLYEEMRDKGMIKPEKYFMHDTAFFEFRHEKVIISFVSRCLCDDLQFVVDRDLIIEYMGVYPVKRTCQSKMNQDKPQKNHNAGIETNRRVNEILNEINGTGKTLHRRI